MPQECYFVFSIVWPAEATAPLSPSVDDVLKPRTSVVVSPRGVPAAGISQAMLPRTPASASPGDGKRLFAAAACLACFVVAAVGLSAMLPELLEGHRAASMLAHPYGALASGLASGLFQKLASSTTLETAQLVGGQIYCRPVAVAVLFVVALTGKIAQGWLRKLRLRARSATLEEWSKEAWASLATRHHVGEQCGGCLSSLVLGADSVERADKWRRVFGKVTTGAPNQILRARGFERSVGPHSAPGSLRDPPNW